MFDHLNIFLNITEEAGWLNDWNIKIVSTKIWIVKMEKERERVGEKK